MRPVLPTPESPMSKTEGEGVKEELRERERQVEVHILHNITGPSQHDGIINQNCLVSTAPTALVTRVVEDLAYLQ